MSQARPFWTIDELGAQVALALSVDYEGAPNQRVRDVPDRRTIRYYTTLGLLDRPAEMRGRTALYGVRHLLQLVAIKRLQARGLSLAAIQQQMLGLNDAALRRLARLPAGTETAPVPPPPVAQERAAFWTASPSPVPETNGALPAAERPAPAVLHGIMLGDAVTLLLAAARPLEDDDLSAIRAVAAPLLKLLETRRLLGPAQEKEIS
jgi:DNA-binding transcriptional MerR regulator